MYKGSSTSLYFAETSNKFNFNFATEKKGHFAVSFIKRKKKDTENGIKLKLIIKRGKERWERKSKTNTQTSGISDARLVSRGNDCDRAMVQPPIKGNLSISETANEASCVHFCHEGV